MRPACLSTFTPSIMSHEMLEAVLVQRHYLVDTLLDRVRASATGVGKHHSLLVGPRGIGKTHIVSLVYHRVKAMEDLSGTLLTAWLREDEWGISTFRDLLMKILRALAAEYKDSGLEEKVETLYTYDARRAEQQAGELLKEYVNGRTLLVLMENLDEMFANLANTGQERFRSYIQENPFFTLVATSPSLFSGIQLRTSPFYGFFQVHHLEELSFDAAVEFLAKVASVCDDGELADFVKTPTGRGRIRAVHHLGGGNPRIYTMFSQFLTRTSLDDLTEAVMQTLEKLTPYYQSRMALLSAQQRKVIEYLIDRRGAAPVKDIARSCFATNQAIASQLKILRDKGYVRSTTSGRESYYELREPLMRICIEVKKHLGEPIRLFVDFLRIWYSRQDLQSQVAILASQSALDYRYIAAALSEEPHSAEDVSLSASRKALSEYMADRDLNHALEASEEVLSVQPSARGWVYHATILWGLGRSDEALVSARRATDADPNDREAMALCGLILQSLGRREEARALIDESLAQEPKDQMGWMTRGLALYELGKYHESVGAFDRVTAAIQQGWAGWLYKGKALCRIGRVRRALSSFSRAFRLDSTAKMAYTIASELGGLGLAKEAATWFEKVLSIDPQHIPALAGHTSVLGQLGRYSEALVASEKLRALTPTHIGTLMLHGAVLRSLRRNEDAAAILEEAVKVAPANADAWESWGVTLLDVSRYDEALRALGKALSLDGTLQVASVARLTALASLQQWNDVVGALDAAIPALSGNKELQEAAIIQTGRRILFADTDPICLQEILGDFANVLRKHGMVDALVPGIMASAALTLRPDMQLSKAKALFAAWTRIASDEPVLKTGIHLCEAAIRYKETSDERVLLELADEERALLRRLIDYAKAAKSPTDDEVLPDRN